MVRLQISEDKIMKKIEKVPLASPSSPKLPLKKRNMGLTLAASPGVSNDTIHKILHEDLGL